MVRIVITRLARFSNIDFGILENLLKKHNGKYSYPASGEDSGFYGFVTQQDADDFKKAAKLNSDFSENITFS